MPQLPRTSTWHLPQPDGETQKYWDAAAEGKLLIKHCRRCGRNFFYPRDHCPICWATDTEWLEASGNGAVYTFTIVRQNDLPPFNERVPYVIAIVELEEGVRMTANIEGCEPEAVSCGMRVVVDFRTEQRSEDETVSLPIFRPPD